jgi:CRP-like cAMP-binding protein
MARFELRRSKLMFKATYPRAAFESTGANVLERITPRSRERLMAIAGSLRYRPGTEIFGEGSDTPFVGVVELGRVALRLRVPEHGQRITFATIEPGELLGWSALVAPYRATAEAVATEDSGVLAFDATRLRELLARDPEVAAELMPIVLETVAQRLTSSWHQLADTFSPRTFGPW